MPTWDPDRYGRFEAERTQPARDLLARVPLTEAASVVDLGSGPGNSTALLLERFPDAQVTGVDTSESMLKRARTRLPDVAFEKVDIATWAARPGAHDLIFSNAALHWLPRHDALFPTLVERLRPGGVLAVQMPANFAAPTHAAAREVADDPRWRARIGGRRDEAPVADASHYHDVLAPHCGSVDVWETRYHHALPGPRAVVEWTRGSALRPMLDGLDTHEQADFVADYQTRIEKAYPPRRDGGVLLPFRRLFIVAVRRSD